MWGRFIMLHLTETTIGIIMLAVAIVIMTCCGVLSGLEGEAHTEPGEL